MNDQPQDDSTLPEDASAEEPVAAEVTEEAPDPVLSLEGNDWLDPANRRHGARRRRPEPKGPVDKIKRKWRRWRRKRRRLAKTAPWYRPRNLVVGTAVLMVVALLSVLIAAYATIGGIRRAPLLPAVSSVPSAGTNLLLIGSNSHVGDLAPDTSTLIIQFVHISASKQAAQVIDLPRDLVIGTGSQATTLAKRFAAQGVKGVVGTLQNAMHLTVDHAIQTSFDGYARVTDDLGDVTIATATGPRPFSGNQAKAYVEDVPRVDGSVETGRRFQFWSKALLEATLQPGVLLNPSKDWSILNHTADNIVVDESFTTNALIGFVWGLRALKPSNIDFFTAPNNGYGTLAGKRVLLAKPVYFQRLSTAIRTDNLATLGLFR